jgi:hypothetical protein
MANSLVRQMVARCHVAESNRTVIRYVISRLRKGYVTYRAMSREQRRLLLRETIAAHTENRALYRFVMRGGR